jgi:uncharacterized protein YdaT
MPWNAQNFAKKHNHSMSPAQAAKAASVANAILKKNGGNEGQAIAIGNATAQGTLKHAAGRKLGLQK